MTNREDNLGRTRARIEELRERSRQIAERNVELSRQDWPGGSTPEQVERAQQHADMARERATQAEEHAKNAFLRAAQAHDAAADRHDELASSGSGGADLHRQRAREHREMSDNDRAQITERFHT